MPPKVIDGTKYTGPPSEIVKVTLLGESVTETRQRGRHSYGHEKGAEVTLWWWDVFAGEFTLRRITVSTVTGKQMMRKVKDGNQA